MKGQTFIRIFSLLCVVALGLLVALCCRSPRLNEKNRSVDEAYRARLNQPEFIILENFSSNF